MLKTRRQAKQHFKSLGCRPARASYACTHAVAAILRRMSICTATVMQQLKAIFPQLRCCGSERDLLQWKKVRFLAGRVGETFSGRITGVQAFGLFVQLDAWFVDGLVPVRTMADDFYVHEPENHSLVGQEQGRIFQLAQPVEVELVGIDERRRGLQLKIAGMPEPRRPRRPRGDDPPSGSPAARRTPVRPRTSRYDRKR